MTENIKKHIIIISGQKPYYGGASTTAYNLTKLLNEDFNVNTYFINIRDVKNEEIDPDNVGNTHSIILFKNALFFKFASYLSLIFSFNRIRYIILFFKIKRMLKVKKLNPDLIIVNIPAFFNLINRLFSNRKIVFLVNGHFTLLKEWNKGLDATQLMKLVDNKERVVENNNLFPKKSNASVIFNSKITQNLYSTLNHYQGKSNVLFFNIIPNFEFKLKPFNERKYDIAVILSNFNRKVKNIDLSLEICKLFPNATKIAIGENSSMFEDCPNTEISPLLHQEEIYKLLNNVKLVLLTSWYDSSPGLQAEAIINGSNVLSSRNIGWSEKLDKECVVENYFDLMEWKNKSEFLMHNYQSNILFKEILQNSDHKIKNYLSDILQE